MHDVGVGLIAERTAAGRLRLADFFDGLTDDQLDAQSLCEAWTVREVLAHSAMPFAVGFPRLVWRIAKQKGNVDRASEAIAAELAQRPVGELTGLLRAHAGDRVPAPGVGPMGQLADHLVHLRDCARPLGLETAIPLRDWRLVLDWLPTRQASLGVVAKGRLDGLALRATDQQWAWGSGAVLAGPSEALAMGVAGRAVAIPELSGPGVRLLASRLGATQARG